METRVRFIIVGGFALAAIVGVFLFAFWVHGASGLSSTRSLRVEFAGSASGLRPGSAVLFNGVRIGEVTRISFDRVRADLVNADLAVEAAAPLRVDARVGVEAQGLLGTTVVAIYGVSADSPLLPGSAVLHAGASSSLSEQARAALTEIQALAAENKAPLKDILKNVDVFSQALSRNSGKLDGIVAALEKFLGQGPKPPPPQFLTLRAPTEFAPVAPLNVQVAVAEVSAPVAFHTQRIMSRTGPDSPLSLGEGQWIDATPKLIQLKLVEAFENSNLGRTVGLPLESGAADYQLLIELRRFEIDLGEKKAFLELSARIAAKDGRVAAARMFRGSADGAASDGEAAAQSLGLAFADVARQVVEWTAVTVK